MFFLFMLNILKPVCGFVSTEEELDLVDLVSVQKTEILL